MRPLSRADFESLVSEALDSLPDDLYAYMENVEIVVEDAPGREVTEDLDEGESILGLYQGIPLPDRGSDYFGVLPDKITLYKHNLEREARSRREVRDLVITTVIHEVAHHFGIDDQRLDELGWT